MENFTHGPKFKDLTGQKFHHLTVIRFHGKYRGKLSIWWCRCDCGKELPVLCTNLTRNHTTSCGCVLRAWQAIGGGRKTHGESGGEHRTKEYEAWAAARGRTMRKSHKHWRYYGGRGIKMCSGIKDDYLAWKALLGVCPPDKVSVGRIDNDGNYSCGKCHECLANGWPMNLRWETWEEQTNNQTRSIHFDGKSVAQIATEQGKPIPVLRRELGLQITR